MTIPSPDRWATLSPLLDELLDLAEPQRGARLLALRAGDPALANELQALLSEGAQAASEGFLAGAVPLTPGEGAASSLAGQHLGPYLLEEPLGQGGGGSVWRARREDGRFEGAVAIKLLHLSLLGRAGAERFRREGHILARLKHPHIASLLDAGVTPGGQPYLVLELVQGERIDRHCDALRLSIDARLALFDDVLAAVAHAHTHGVIHRDLKPGNILVTHEGQVKLLDFGVAKLLDDEAGSGESTELTREGGRALTPEYAAPEQLRGEGVTTATDVYALGVLLYQLLCGQHPTAPSSGNAADALRATVDTEPAPASRRLSLTDQEIASRRASNPQRLQRTLSGDLDTIVSHALRKAPGERYATVAALAEDLRRYRAHEPVIARPDSVAYRARKFVRRHRGAVAAGVLTSVAIVAGVVGTTTMAWRAQRERDQALEETARAQSLRELNHFMLQSLPDGKPFRVADLLARGTQFVDQFPGLSPQLRTGLLIEIASEYMAHSELDQAIVVAEQAYERSRAMGDVRQRAHAACLLGAMLGGKSQAFERARQLVAEALVALGTDAQLTPWRIQCLVAASDVEAFAGKGETALRWARQARSLAEGMNPPNLRLKREALERLGSASRITGQIGAAAEAYGLVGLVLAEEGRDRTAAGKVNGLNQGALLSLAGRHLEARQVLDHAIAMERQPGAEASPGAPLLGHYSRVLAALGQFDEALTTVQRAQQLADAAKDHTFIILAHMTSVSILRQMGRHSEAQKELMATREILAKVLPAGHYVHGLATVELALLGQGQGQTARALAVMQEGIEILRSNRSSGMYLPMALLRQGELLLTQDRLDEAAARSEEAGKLLTTMLGPDMPSAHKADAARLTGLIHRAQGQDRAARQAFVAAYENYRPTLGSDHPRTQEARGWVAP